MPFYNCKSGGVKLPDSVTINLNASGYTDGNHPYINGSITLPLKDMGFSIIKNTGKITINVNSKQLIAGESTNIDSGNTKISASVADGSVHNQLTYLSCQFTCYR